MNHLVAGFISTDGIRQAYLSSFLYQLNLDDLRPLAQGTPACSELKLYRSGGAAAVTGTALKGFKGDGLLPAMQYTVQS